MQRIAKSDLVSPWIAALYDQTQPEGQGFGIAALIPDC